MSGERPFLGLARPVFNIIGVPREGSMRARALAEKGPHKGYLSRRAKYKCSDKDEPEGRDGLREHFFYSTGAPRGGDG